MSHWYDYGQCCANIKGTSGQFAAMKVLVFIKECGAAETEILLKTDQEPAIEVGKSSVSVVVGVSFTFDWGPRFLPQGASGSLEPLFEAVCGRSLVERVLFCLPPRSRRGTSFGRDNKSVQSLVSLLEVTPERAASRHRSQASSAAFWMWDLRERRAEKTSSRSGVSEWRGSSLISLTRLLNIGWLVAQRGLVLVEIRGVRVHAGK